MRKEISLSRWRFVKIAVALSVIALFLLVQPIFAYEFHFDSPDQNNPTRYNLRWGQQEGDADLVKCIHGQTVGYSYGVACFEKATNMKMSLVLGDDPSDVYIIDWYLVRVDLYRVVGIDANGNPVREDQPFMSLNIVSSKGEGIGKTYILGPLPDYIEWCDADILAVLVYEFPGEPPIGADTLGERMETFIVLDKPKAPMDPAWVSVLNISCRWARKMSTWKEAADKLQSDVFNNCKYSGFKFFHHFGGWQDTEIGRESTEETFHLKAFLSQSEPLEGNCNALTNFLCCLMTSVGINAIVQRTNRIVLENGNKVGRWTFRTKLIRPAGWLSDGYGQWGYHQIILIETEGNRVWDGNLIFKDPLAIPADMVRENPSPAGVEFGSRAHWEAEGCKTYFCRLIDFNSPYTDPNYRWETNHPNTKLTPPKLKVTTADWYNDGCF